MYAALYVEWNFAQSFLAHFWKTNFNKLEKKLAILCTNFLYEYFWYQKKKFFFGNCWQYVNQFIQLITFIRNSFFNQNIWKFDQVSYFIYSNDLVHTVRLFFTLSKSSEKQHLCSFHHLLFQWLTFSNISYNKSVDKIYYGHEEEILIHP